MENAGQFYGRQLVTDRSVYLFIGTYTRREEHVDGHARGIYVYRFDSEKGTLDYISTAEGVVNPSYLALHPGKPFLYAVSEINDYQGRETGGVAAFSFDRDRGELTVINTVDSRGTMPCHLSLDEKGKLLFAANYISGSFAVFGLREDGALTESLSWVQREGGGVNSDRQEGPHTHAVVFDSKNRHLFVPDLGNDQLARYTVDREGMVSQEKSPVLAAPGSGPRHLVFHPGMKFAYQVNELLSTVVAMKYDRTNGLLTPVQTISALPEGPAVNSAAAAVRVHPDGRSLYVSNRGHDSVALFSINSETGMLTATGWESTRGKTPRDISISPDGRYLCAANQDSDCVAFFRVRPADGTLEYLYSIEVPSPVCLVF